MAWLRKEEDRDVDILEAIGPVAGDLWRPLRFLADLKAVWADLNEDERREIQESSVYRERFHEKLAEKRVGELMSLACRLRNSRHRSLRHDLVTYLETWQRQEPDKLKIFAAIAGKRLNECRSEDVHQI